MSTPTPPRYPWFDLVRGLSALLVCAGHLRAVMLADYPDVLGPTWWQQAIYALTSLGHQAVMVFFVLSGFFVGGAVLRPGFSWRHYAIARLSRLWVVLLPCLLATWAIDHAILGMAPEVLNGAYQARWHSGPEAGRYDASWLTLLGNVLFLQTVAVPIFGSNSPLWSLANEFWYYLLFPMLAMALGWMPAGRFGMACRVAMGGFACLLMVCLPREMMSGFLVWLMGAGVAACQQSGMAKVRAFAQRQIVLATMLWLVALAYGKAPTLQGKLGLSADLLLGAAFSWWCLSMTAQVSTKPAMWNRLAGRLSDLSYSLYLSHFPVVMLIAVLGFEQAKWQPGPGALLAFALLLAWLVLVGWLVWYAFERHTPQVRRALTLRLSLAA